MSHTSSQSHTRVLIHLDAVSSVRRTRHTQINTGVAHHQSDQGKIPATPPNTKVSVERKQLLLSI